MNTVSSNSATLDSDQVENLSQIARQAFNIAPEKCLLGHGCCEFHSIWTLARISNPSGAGLSGSEFFKKEISDLIQTNSAPRILVSGGSDTGVMTLAVSTIQKFTCNPYLLFLDRCQTPVELNRRLLKEQGLDGKAVAMDLLEAKFEKFDLILAHSILLYFDPKDIGSVFAKWASLLKPGGRILISNIVGDESGDRMGENETSQVERSIELVLQTALSLGFTEDEIVRIRTSCEKSFSKKFTDFPLVTLNEIRLAMQEARLSVNTLNTYDRSQLSQRGPFTQGLSYGGQRIEICGIKL